MIQVGMNQRPKNDKSEWLMVLTTRSVLDRKMIEEIQMSGQNLG
jgi:hypothetical protein